MVGRVTASQMASASAIVLLPFRVRFDVSWWDEPDLMTEALQLARPMMSRSTRLDADQTGRQQL